MEDATDYLGGGDEKVDGHVPVSGRESGQESPLPRGFTRNWWAGRWLRALTPWVSHTRLARGQVYARGGQVSRLDVQPGLILAHVQGSQAQPYRVTIEVETFSEEVWDRILDAMTGQALYAAQLLNGDMPHGIEDLFESVGASLFPSASDQLKAECSCAGWTNPCKHIVAIYYALGEQLDNDPFLLFVMRGRTREQIMAALRARRIHVGSAVVGSRDPLPSPTAAPPSLDLEQCLEVFWRLGLETEELQIKIAPPEVEAEILKILGDPSFAGKEDLSEKLMEVYRSVSQRALELAFGEYEKVDDGTSSAG